MRSQFSRVYDSDQTKCTFEEWLKEFGYDRELFVCKEEFLINEYQDEVYENGYLMMKLSLTSIKKIKQRRVSSMMYMEKFGKILKDLDVLSKEQRKHKDEIPEVLTSKDAVMVDVMEEEEAV